MGKHTRTKETRNRVIAPAGGVPGAHARDTHPAATGPASWMLHDLIAQAGILVDDQPPESPDSRSARRTLRDSIPDVRVTSITADSRQVTPGACFVAIRGGTSDGHDHVNQAIAKGAVAVVVEDRECLPGAETGASRIPIIAVADTRSALSQLAATFFGLRSDDGRAPRLIGVTGTNGKTTVAWMLRAILRAAGQPTALLGTIEYDLIDRKLPAPLTTPDPVSLCRHLATAMANGATHAVIEVSSHALDQRRTDGLRFAAGVFTNLSGDHLDYHQTMDAYLEAKQRLFRGLDDAATAVVFADDPAAPRMVEGSSARVIRYGLDSPPATPNSACAVPDSAPATGGTTSLDVRASVHRIDRTGCEFTIHFPADSHSDCCRPHSGPYRSLSIHLNQCGRHNVLNALAAAATAHALGISGDDIATGLAQLDVIPGRLQRAEPEGCPFSVFVDYAHTDDALENALSTLRELTKGRLICVFGCGGDRDRPKRPRMAQAAAKWADVAVVTSDNPRSENPERIIDDIAAGFGATPTCTVIREVDRRSAIARAIDAASPGDTILIAGKGHETVQVVGDRAIEFDDVAIARECLDDRATVTAKADMRSPKSAVRSEDAA